MLGGQRVNNISYLCVAFLINCMSQLFSLETIEYVNNGYQYIVATANVKYSWLFSTLYMWKKAILEGKLLQLAQWSLVKLNFLNQACYHCIISPWTWNNC